MPAAKRNYYCQEGKAGLTRRGAPRYRVEAGAGITHLLFGPFTAVMSVLAKWSPYLYRTFASALKHVCITASLDARYHNIMRPPFGNQSSKYSQIVYQRGSKVSSESGNALQRFQEMHILFGSCGMCGVSPLRLGRLLGGCHFQGEDSSGDVYPFRPSTHCATAAEHRITDGSFNGLSGF